jgi:hypothetical protein
MAPHPDQPGLGFGDQVRAVTARGLVHHSEDHEAAAAAMVEATLAQENLDELHGRLGG